MAQPAPPNVHELLRRCAACSNEKGLYRFSASQLLRKPDGTRCRLENLQRRLASAEADAQEHHEERLTAYTFIEHKKDELRAVRQELHAARNIQYPPPVYWKHPEPQTWMCTPCKQPHTLETPVCPGCNTDNSECSVEELGLLVRDAYQEGGHTCSQAQQMLRDMSTHVKCKCPVAEEFDNLRVLRIENHYEWERFRF
ncbi:hypothetical protein T492DRAFT_1118592 [Pavlovales sp. CCMP2436]|nr:hypothetical protein T492DRAFT_1118592 [Pavlovales sp. CCMP2436]